MNELLPVCFFLMACLATYLLHSTIALFAAYAVLIRTHWVTHPETRVLAWKTALLLPAITAFTVTLFAVPHLGLRIPISMEAASASDHNPVAADFVASGPTTAKLPANSTSSSAERINLEALRNGSAAAIHEQQPVTNVVPIRRLLPWVSWVMVTWMALTTVRFLQLALRLGQLERLRRGCLPVIRRDLSQILTRLCGNFRVGRSVALFTSTQISGPMTAGVLHPFIALPSNLVWDDEDQGEALLAHEILHVAKWDAAWNLVLQVLGAIVPFQPFYSLATKQLRKEMDFVADWLATPSP